ncbi:viral A-type inclusion protein [Caviibacter abscessus]|uniref:viral A-type inclusion protein n=1 Tax=Caviibacter abscessus TaxID=1766719 RepID=UPI00083287A0|nr:viral A-type inclusion protein [Caviibacter abscessus]
MKGKMINANKINDMEMFNIKNQAKVAMLLQKIGKGKRKVEISLSKNSQKYLDQMIDELKKQMNQYKAQMGNIFEFLDYLKKQVHVEKGQKREKQKKVLLSYEEQDYLVMQAKSTIKEIDKIKAELKWYNLIKKVLYSSVKTQNEVLLDELLNRK